MLARKAFFSIMGVTDPAHHQTYNAYHQLDHRPENLALEGVRWGDRWVRSPDCAEWSSGSDRNFDDAHYLTMYWLGGPLEPTLKRWTDLGELAYLMGRRPDLGWRKDHLQAFLDPVKGHVAPRVLVSADALPFRPVRGIHLTVSRFLAHDGGATHDLLAWYDRVRFPQLIATPGVAGLWTFVSADLLTPDRDTRSSYTDREWTRITLLYLDEDPLEVAARLSEQAVPDHHNIEDIRFATPMRAIQPWQWDWFDGQP